MQSLNEPEAFWTAVSSDHFFCFFDRLQILFNGYLWLSWRAFGNLNQGIFNHVASEQLCIMDLSLQESSGWILHRRYICKTWSWPTHRSQSQDVANILLMVIRYRPIVKLIFPHFNLLRRWSELVHWRQAERLLQLHRQASAPQSGSDCNYLGWRWDRYHNTGLSSINQPQGGIRNVRKGWRSNFFSIINASRSDSQGYVCGAS